MSSSPSLSQTALITGASRGLGRALADALAERGWNLIIDARDASILEEARSSLALRTKVAAITGDIADPLHRSALVQVAREWGGVDAVVNNASILGPSPQPSLLQYPLQELERVYLVNAISPLALIQEVFPFLKQGACIINVTSDAGVEAYEGWGGYGSSKAALEQISNILAAELSQFRVYWVDPGDMRTDLHQQAFPGEDISDRPLPKVSVPGFLALLTGSLPSGRYQARSLGKSGDQDDAAIAPSEPVRELRVALTAEDFAQAVAFYRDGLGLATVKEWDSPAGRGIVLAAGRGTIELLDPADSAYTDQVEVGERVSGPVRLALEVPDVPAAAASLAAHGGHVLSEAVHTTWADLNQRVQAPDGMQISLFQPDVESVE